MAGTLKKVAKATPKFQEYLRDEHGKDYSLETLWQMDAYQAHWYDSNGKGPFPAIAFKQSNEQYHIHVFRPSITDAQGNVFEKKGWVYSPGGDDASSLRGNTDADELYLVEGEWDALRMVDAGFKNTFTATGGAGNFKPEWVEPFKGKTITICYDNDKGGRDGASRAARLLSRVATVKIATFPDAKNLPLKYDISDYLKQHTPEELRGLLDGAKKYKPPKERKRKEDQPEEVFQPFMVEGGILYEMCFDPTGDPPVFFVCLEEPDRIFTSITRTDGVVVRPPYEETLRKGVLKLPRFPMEPVSYTCLFESIRAFITRHVILPGPEWLELSAYYVMLSWLFDRFPVLPYLHVYGESGHGKSTYLNVLGSLCYRTLSMGGTSSACLYHVTDLWRGTVVLDEQDFLANAEKHEDMLNVLLNGFEFGKYVFRLQASADGRRWEARGFDCYGPKLLASIRPFAIEAIRNRCISINMTDAYHQGVPQIHTDRETMEREAIDIRNQLLAWRLRKYFDVGQVETDAVPTILEPRVRQIFGPLLTVIEDQDARDRVNLLAAEFNKNIIMDRGLSWESQIVKAVLSQLAADQEWIPLKAITGAVNEGSTEKKPVLPRTIGRQMTKWGFGRMRTKDGVQVRITKDQRESLAKRFGMDVQEQGAVPIPF